MGTSRITTESIAAESILCTNLCWQQWSINEHLSKKYSKSQPKAGKYLLKKCSKMKAVSNLYLLYEKCGKIKQLQPFQNKPTWKTTATEWTGTSRITTESIAAESILCANLCWQQWSINEHVSKKYSKSQPKAGKYLLKNVAKSKLYQIMYLL